MKSSCETCRFRAYSERKPDSIIARLWRWHTKWCPGWKAYQRELAEQEEDSENGRVEESAE
jgi:hypothetical protein